MLHNKKTSNTNSKLAGIVNQQSLQYTPRISIAIMVSRGQGSGGGLLRLPHHLLGGGQPQAQHRRNLRLPGVNVRQVLDQRQHAAIC